MLSPVHPSKIIIRHTDEQQTDGHTDKRTDAPTDGRTHPLIEMRQRI